MYLEVLTSDVPSGYNNSKAIEYIAKKVLL